MKDKRLEAAIAELAALESTDKVRMQGGKWYVMVKDRLRIFRKHFGSEATISTEVISSDAARVQVRAIISIDGIPVSCGLAEETRDGKGVNARSALENCETGAVGRALAMLGLAGDEFPSAEEMLSAGTGDPVEMLKGVYMALSKEQHQRLNGSFAAIKQALGGA